MAGWWCAVCQGAGGGWLFMQRLPNDHTDSGTHAGNSKEQSGTDHHASGSESDHHAPAATPTTHTHADGKEHVHED